MLCGFSRAVTIESARTPARRLCGCLSDGSGSRLHAAGHHAARPGFGFHDHPRFLAAVLDLAACKSTRNPGSLEDTQATPQDKKQTDIRFASVRWYDISSAIM